MVGKFIAWLLGRAGYEVMTHQRYLLFRASISELNDKIEELNSKLVELDSVICSTMECVEEIRDAQQAAVPAKQNAENAFGEMLNEYLWGYQQNRSDDE